MILRGILERSLSSQLCIRGFAPIKELARISKADYTYQRELLPGQEKRISTFLDEEEYLFFPEVILSYKVKKDLGKAKTETELSPLQELEQKGNYKSNVDKATLKVRKVNYRNSQDVRGTDTMSVVELSLDSQELNNLIKEGKQPFNRVDGNHRLKAAELATSSKVERMTVPFCIILTEELYMEEFKDGKLKTVKQFEGEKFERVVFYNINTKTIPLSQEENLRVILDDEINFPDAFVKEKFGWEYFAIRKIFKGLPKDLHSVYPYLGNDFLTQPRTLSQEIVELLVENKIITKTQKSIESINTALRDVNQYFGNFQRLRKIKGTAITVAALYLYMTRESSIENFVQWLFKNHIDDIDKLKPKSLIKIYQKIRETKQKQIFVSMQFDEDTKPHYKAICKAVEEINNAFKMEIKLREIRIDMFNRGHSYKIDDEILSLIEESGLLIADLTKKNANVYQELGYLMGLNQGKGLKQENFILIMKQTKDSKDSDVGFNIRPFQQLRFTSDLELVDKLKDSILEYYEIPKAIAIGSHLEL